MLKTIIAIFLFYSEFPVTEIQDEEIRRKIVEIAIQKEVIDSREVKYIMSTPNVETDLKLLRTRYQDLKNAPFLADACRFPPKDLCVSRIVFNKQYMEHLMACRPMNLSRVEIYDEVIEETKKICQIYDLIRDIQTEYYYITVKRYAMQNLRNLIGDKNYYSGNLPPCVPIWRFNSID